MNLGLYVGSFNPVHKDHIRVARGLIKKQIVDKVLFVPTKNYWDKKDLIDIKHRIKMLKLYETEKLIIDEKRNHFDYTYQIIDDLKKENKNLKIFLIIGADNVLKFHLWKKVQAILKNKVIIVGRDDLDVKPYIKKFKESKQFILIDDLKTKNIASTLIREQIKKKVLLKDLLDQKVINYIKKEKLYEREIKNEK